MGAWLATNFAFVDVDAVANMENKLIPRIPHFFFKFYCSADRYEELHGDLEELFNERVKNKGLTVARLLYIMDIIRCCQPYAWKRVNISSISSGKIMLSSNLIIAWRNVRRHRFYSVINVSGLAIGIAACLLIFLFVLNELRYDKYNANADRIYRIDTEAKLGQNYFRITQRSAPEAQTMMEEFPEIESAVRFRNAGSYLVKAIGGAETIKENKVIWTDSTFFKIFSLKVLEGNPSTALREPASVAISKKIASKYFPGKRALGQILTLNNKYMAKVTAIYEDIPTASHFHFDILISMTGSWPVAREAQSSSFMSENFTTYLLLREGASAQGLEKKLPQFIEKYLGPEYADAFGEGFTMKKFLAAGNKYNLTLRPLTDIHLHSDLGGEFEANGSITSVYLFVTIAGFILLIACINFMNLSTARSSTRAREVGVRKVLGSQRAHLVRQFLTESVLLTVFAFVIALGLAYVFLPVFNNLSQKKLELPFANPLFYSVLLISAALIGIIAGLYPSFFLSAFKPLDVLKGQTWLGVKSASIRSGLVVFQFVISIFLIIAAITVNTQLSFIQNKKLGFEKDQVIILHDAYALRPNVQSFKNEISKMSAIDIGTISGYIPVEAEGSLRNFSVFWNEGMQPTAESMVSFQRWQVDEDYIKTFRMKIKMGRDFSKDFPSDSTSVIINETAAKRLGLGTDPIGKKITRSIGTNPNETETYSVIGVVEDFHYSSMEENILPLGLFLSESDQCISFLFKPNKTGEVISSIEKLWKQIAPDQPFKYSFLDKSFERMYSVEERLGKIFVLFAMLAIVVACLGLFALTAFSAEQRTKEIGIRKVLGASTDSIIIFLSKEFGKLILIAFLIATPIAWYSVNRWLENYAYKAEIGVSVYVVAGILTFVIAFGTMCFQCVKAALVNPAQSLKSE